MIGLLQRLVGLRDEGGGSLDALLAVGDLLRQLPEPLRLQGTANGKKKRSEQCRQAGSKDGTEGA